MTEADRIYQANIDGLAAFKKLSQAERTARLIEIGILDKDGNLAAEYGGHGLPSAAASDVAEPPARAGNGPPASSRG